MYRTNAGAFRRDCHGRYRAGMYPPPHLTCMYPPPHMTCMYPPSHTAATAQDLALDLEVDDAPSEDNRYLNLKLNLYHT